MNTPQTKTQTKARTKTGFAPSLDLLLSFVIIISTLLPIIAYSQQQMAFQPSLAKNSQKLSSLLQISELYYTNLSAQKTTSASSLTTYVHPGILSPSFQLPQNPDYSYMGLGNFQILDSPPKILSQNQFCLSREMLDSLGQARKIWFCAS
ncbi:MAG: hypothetical protein V1822_04270 [Candidatus Micrarchaeota archaeon]